MVHLQWIEILCFSVYLATSYIAAWKVRASPYAKCKYDAGEPWSYRGENGPRYWGKLFPTCNGKEQSPVAINRHEVVFDKNLEKLIMTNYDVPITMGAILNNGHTVQVNITDGVERGIYVKDESYRLMQLHFHWGDAYYKGAEHIVDGIQFAMEMHLVHQNRYQEVAVIAVLFQEQGKGCPELQKIIEHFPMVPYKDMESRLKYDLYLNGLIPSNPSSFYRYQGSLTTPACAEGVTWSVLTKPMAVSTKQMAEFRKLYSAPKSEASKTCKLVNNFRPVQPLNNRRVFVSN